MARRKNRASRGLVRDSNGIVVARTHQHPKAFFFEAIPNYPNPDDTSVQVPINMTPEMTQILAIHIFDNLNCFSPDEVKAMLERGASPDEIRDPVYRLVKAKGDAPMGLPGAMWVPHSIPDEFFEPEVEPEGVPDVDGLTEEQVVALEKKLANRAVARSTVDNLDDPSIVVKDPAPHEIYKARALEKMQERVEHLERGDAG